MEDKIVVHVDSEILELIPGFMENRRKEIGQLRADLAERRFEAVRVVGHTLAGAGSSYGFDDITRIGRELERTASAAASGADADVPRLQRLTDELEYYLQHVELSYT